MSIGKHHKSTTAMQSWEDMKCVSGDDYCKTFDNVTFDHVSQTLVDIETRRLKIKIGKEQGYIEDGENRLLHEKTGHIIEY